MALWQHGLHDYGWFDTPPYGPKFLKGIFSHFLKIKASSPTPVSWMSMNSNCREKIHYPNKNMNDQAKMVEGVNHFMLDYTRTKKIPYFDAATTLRLDVKGVLRRCRISADGVHMKMWADIMRAKMFLNHVCDEDMNWIGRPDQFINPDV